MTDPNAFAKLVPGFDFLQGLMKTAGSGVPAMQQWIAPTLDPDELDKRIRDLRTVQFWLEQNAKLIATSIQALEVQRMTLATLKTMNLPMAGLHEAMSLKPQSTPEAEPEPAPAPEPAPTEAADPPAPRSRRTTGARAAAATKPSDAPSAGAAAAIDPMQWWGALTQQFSDIASRAIADMPGMAPVMPSSPGPSARTTAAKAAGKGKTKGAGKGKAKAATRRKGGAR